MKERLLLAPLKTNSARREREYYHAMQGRSEKDAWLADLLKDFATLEATLADAIATLEHYRTGGSLDDPLTEPTRAAAWLDAYYQKEKKA